MILLREPQGMIKAIRLVSALDCVKLRLCADLAVLHPGLRIAKSQSAYYRNNLFSVRVLLYEQYTTI